MSTLGQRLRMERGERALIHPPLRFVDVHQKWDQGQAVCYEAARYKIKAEFGTNAAISEDDLRKGNSAMIVDRCKRAITEGIFEEYRKPLYDAVRAIDSYEPTKARDILLKVLDNMFGAAYSDPMEQPT